MSLRSESRETASVDERSSSGANSVTSDDSSERTTKKSEVSRNTLKYSYEFLLKLQKSKLSKKPPDCIERLRQECILRETWRSDKDKDSERDTEFPAALTKPPPSFRGGCKVDKAVLSDNPNPGSNSVKKSAASKGERRVGSGRLGSYNKDRESDYGYPQERSRRLFDHQGNEPLKRSNGRYVEMNSSRGGGDDEPEWFTEGPTSQTDTIELGGFEDKARKVRTPSPSVRKPTVVNSPPEGVDLLKEFYMSSGNGSGSSQHKSQSVNFAQFFAAHDASVDNAVSSDVVEDELAFQGGSRFMSKVFAKTFDEEPLPSPKPVSPPTYAKDLQTSPRPVLVLLENSKEPSSSAVTSLLRDMFPPGETRSEAIAAQGTASSFDSLEELFSRSAQQANGGMSMTATSTHSPIASAAPMAMTTAPSSATNNVLDVEKGVQGKNILELLLSGANVVNAPSTPHFAKSVEELEADLKMESSRMASNAMFASGANHQPQLIDNRSMMSPGMSAMERSLGLLGDLQSSAREMGHYGGGRHQNAPFMSSSSLPQQQQQQQAYQQTQQHQPPQQQQQQQANSTHNNASLDIMRLLMEGSPMPERDQGKPYKQDVRNVPTSVLLQDKHPQRKTGLQAGGPRPIVKSNKNPPPCLPPTAPSSAETGEDLLQRLFQQQQHEQQFAHHQYQQQHAPQQHHHHHHQQQQQQQQQQSRFRSYYNGGAGGNYNGNSTSSQMRMGASNRRPLTGGHGQRFAPQGAPLGNLYGPSSMNSHSQNMMNPSSETSILSPDDALAKWFGNLSCNQPSLPVPTNVLRVEELERQNNGHRLHQAKPTAT